MLKYEITSTFEEFYKSLSFYAAARYILSGLLYDKFSVKFLLEKYYCKFLNDLKNSRFRKFLILFTGPIPTQPKIDFSNYYKYFLYDINHYQQKDCHHILSDMYEGNNRYCKTIIEDRKCK